jgi:RimJ/RimL family protein N-acetyltransferase
MRVVYLTGDDFYLRAMVLDDKDHAVAWFHSSIPMDALAAELKLKKLHECGWDEPDEMYLAIVRSSDDQVIGSALIDREDRHIARLHIRCAPTLQQGESLRTKVLQLLVRWLRDEREKMVMRIEIPEDEPLLLAAAKLLGMEPATRMREYIARPSGRVDALGYEALNRAITVGTGDA